MVHSSSRLNVSMVKDQSRKLIFEQLLTQEKLTRNDIARNTNLSLGTVKSIFEEFTREGILKEEKDSSRSVGRKPSFVKLLPDSKYICVLSITKEHFYCQVLNLKLNSRLDYAFNYCEDDDFEKIFRNFLNDVKEKVSFILKKDFLGFGISVPGPFFAENDQVICDLIPALNNLRIMELMAVYFDDAPVYIGNDVRLAALAASKNIKSLGNAPLFYVYIAEGVGGACIQDGNVFLGAGYFAGEIGQINLENGKSLENSISWYSMLKRLGLDPETDENLLKKEFFSQWEKHNSQYDDEINRMIDSLAKALSYVVCIINPKNIVIGGKYKFLGDTFLNLLEEKLFSMIIKEHKKNLTISFSEENNRDPVIGSAMTVIDHWFNSGLA